MDRHAGRGYPEALWRLSQLQSNRNITNLFDQPSAAAAPKNSPQDLNAAAIPEMRQWLRRAGYTPQDLSRIRHIHVAGTKGKGSVCAYATAMLCQYGTVGTYTSPHLVSLRERIAINGEPVGQELFASAFFEVWDRFTEAARREGKAAEMAEGPETKPFFFRFLTILAWHIFLREGITNAVMECGIGGEYDATNLLPPEAVSAAVVSQLGIDHVAMLGDSVEKISWHKAGIFKSGVKAFTTRLDHQPGVMQVLRDRAAEKGAHLFEMDRRLVDEWGGVRGNLKGDFQKYNQALALMAVREHMGMDSHLATALQDIPDTLVEGLQKAKLRGRCETIDNETVTWLLDGAHTSESLGEVSKWLAPMLDSGESVVLIFNQQERDVRALLSGFLQTVKRDASRDDDVFTHALFTRNDQHRPAEGEARDMSVQNDAVKTMNELVPKCQTKTFDNLEDALAEVHRIGRLAGEGDRKQKVLVTGSLHLVGGVLQALEPDGLL